MSPWSLVIFDNDGVLVDSERLGNEVLSKVLTEAGYPVTFEDCIRRFMGGTLARTRALIEQDLGQPFAADFEDQYRRELYHRFETELEPVPGAATQVSALKKAGIQVCVASSGTHEKIRLALGAVGLLEHFDGQIFSAEDVSVGKPAPDLFLHAASALSVLPRRCVVVEDSPAGITAARAAGMATIGFVGARPALDGEDSTALLEEAGADVVIGHLSGIPAALEVLNDQ